MWKASNILALKFPQIIDGMNVLLVAWRRENKHIMHLRTHAIMEILNVGSSGGSIPKSTWKEFENVQKHFLTKFLQAKKQTPYTLLFETGSLPIEITLWKGLFNTCLRFKNVPHIDFLELHGKQAKRSKRRIKETNALYPPPP